VVEEAGRAVTELAPGDEVFGIHGGANAEYLAVRASGVIARKPEALTWEEAAAVPDAVGKSSSRRCRRAVKPGGIYVTGNEVLLVRADRGTVAR